MSATLDPLIQQKLAAFARRRRRLIIIKGVLAAVGALLLTMLAVALVDLKWMLPDWVRWSLSGAAYLAVLVVAWRQCLGQLLHAPDERQLARLVEHAEPGLREDLLSAVELGRASGEIFDSEQFRSLLQADVARRMGGVEMKALLPVSLIRRTIGYAAAIVLVAVGMMVASGWRFHTLLLRALFPGANLERVSRTKVNVQEPEGGDRIVPQGDTVRVVVELTGEPSNRARIETMGDGPNSGGWQVMNMEPLGNNRFAATVQVSRASVRYRIKAGDALTRKYLLDARERPYVTEFAKTFHFPKYSELADRSVTEKDGALVALEGTEVELRLKTNQPVKRAELLIEQGKASSTVALTAGMDGLLSGKITMVASGSYRVHLTGADTGFENKFSPENEIRAEPDLLPAVELEKPKNDLILPANELVDIAGNATDDLGLAKVSRLVRINSGGWKETVLATKPGKQTRIADQWDLFQAGVKPGDLLTMKLVATDLKGSKAESRSLQVTITASGFEMRRLQGLEALRALSESVRALDDHATQLAHTVRKTKDGITSGSDDAAVRQAAVAITGAITEFDAKFTESWTALGSALREAKGGHAGAELVMLGRTLARIGFGAAKLARTNAAVISTSPAARKALTETVDTCSEIARRAKLATASADAITLSEEAAVLAENGLILLREQKRLTEMASAAGNDAAQWASIASRLKVTASQTKIIEDILAPMGARSGSGKERSKIATLQLQRHREGLTKSLSPDDKPDKRMMLKLTEFNRAIENSARGFNDWSRELGLRPVALMRDASQETGPAYAAVAKLAEALEPIRKEVSFSAEAKSALADGRWKIASELFKTSGDLEEIRHHADNQFVSDVRQTVAALEALRAIAPGTESAPIREKLDELDAVFRVLESGHNLQEAMDGFTQLASSERWEVRDLSARTDATRDWRWLEARLRMIPDELGRAKPTRAEAELAKVFGDAQGILWKAQQLEAWRSMEREMGGRANFDYTPVTARKDAEQLAGQVKLALDLFRKPMEEARKKLAKLSPTVSQLAAALAKEQAEVKKETEKRAKEEQQKNPEDAKAEAGKQIAQQKQLNEKVETLKDLVRADANKQDILKQDQREKMRDADDALAMLKDPPPKAEQALQDAAASAPAQQKADLERAAEQQQKLADALNQIAEHFEKMEQGKPADETRTALREKEKELGIKEELDAQQAHAQMLAEMAQKDPQQLLKELEAKLPENPAMQKELSTIGKDAVADAGEKLANAAQQESKVAQQVAEEAKQEQAGMQAAQKNAADAAKQAEQAAQAAQKAAEAAKQEAKTAGNQPAEQQAAKAANEAATAAQNAQQAVQAAEQMAKANTPAEAAKAAQQVANKAGEAAKAAEQASGDAKQAQANAQQAAAKGGEHQADNQKSGEKSAEAAQQADKAAQAAKQAQNLAQAAANEAAAKAQAQAAKPNTPQQAANTAAQAAKQAAQAAQAAQQAAQAAQKQANNAANPPAAQQAENAAKQAGAAAQDAQQAAQAAEKAAATGDAQQAAQASQQAAQKAGEAAKAADMAANDAQGAQAAAQQAAAKGGDQQPANQQAAQQAGEAAKQAQAAAKAARQAQAAAQQAAQEAGAMAQQNPQLAKAAQQQQPIAANAADAGAEVARAGRHEQRLGNQPAGEQLAKLGDQIAATAENAVPEAQMALNNAKSAAAAAAPVNEANAQLAAELSALNNQANGQPAQPASAAAQSAPQGAQANAQPAGQSAGQQAAQPSGQPASSQPAGQQAAAAASPTEQQAMARALDALDQQLNPSAAQQAANAQGQQGQQGQQQGQQGQQQNGQQQAQGSQPGQPNQQGNQPGQQGQQGQQQSPSQSAMAQAAQAAQASMRMDRAQSSATQPGSLLGASQSDKSLGGAKAEGTAMNSKDLPNANDLKRGEWGKLPKKLAEQLTKGSQESIPGEYRQAVETYYRVIAEKTKKRQ